MPVKNQRLLFYGLLLALGLMQAALTELHDDEAYYWVYSRFPDWGYYDHPPLLAWLIRAGYWIFPNELGVRLFCLLLNIFTFVLIEALLRPRNRLLFYGIVLSIAPVQLMGFAAVPDIPLLFFTAAFFLVYQKFLAASSWKNALLLGLIAAGMLYSKYQGVLILFFTLLSRPKLFSNYKVYAAGGIAFLLFLPHLWWQYQHDWISFRYQLFESNVNRYRISHTLDYLAGQLLIAGPIAGLILLPAAWLYRPRDPAEKAMKFSLIGIFFFFLASSFRGKVEANWTLPSFVGLVVLSYQYLEEKASWKKWLRLQLPLTLLLVLLSRIAMIVDMVPLRFIKERYHSWKQWPAEMKERTRGLPVVFSASYQRASKYWFYTGQRTFSLNNNKERKNNFDYWHLEDSLLGKPVYYLDKFNTIAFTDSLLTPLGWMKYQYDSAWVSLSAISVRLHPAPVSVKENEAITLVCQPEIPPHYRAYLQAHPALRTHAYMAVFNRLGWIKNIPLGITAYDLLQKEELSVRFSPGMQKGNYSLLFSLQCEPYRPTHNSRKIKLRVE